MGTVRRRVVGAAVALVALAGAGCSDDPASTPVVTEGWTASLVRSDLDGPTQLALAPDGRVLVAELVEGELGGVGRVRDLGVDGGVLSGQVLLDELVLPTGLAVVDEDTLVVQEGRELVRWDLGGGAPSRRVLSADLPWNGRSQGTLTLLDDGRVLHSSTHEGVEPDLVAGSGSVYASAVDGTGGPELVAAGFKVPYAHATDASGRLLVTDVGDGRVDGAQVVEELHVFDGLAATNDGGWPRCTGDNRPAVEWGIATGDCADLPAPLATFPPRSTPTGLAVGADGRVLVALFTTPSVDGSVVEVRPDGSVVTVLHGLRTPQDVLALSDGSFLVTSHIAGELHRLTPP